MLDFGDTLQRERERERERDSRDQGYRNGEVLVEVRPARPVF